MSFAVIRKEAGTNFVLNLSAETTGNFAAHNGATVTRFTTSARYGNYAYNIVPGGTNRGINLTLATLSNNIHHVTAYFRRNFTPFVGTLQASLDSGATYNALNAINSSASAFSTQALSRWVRYEITIPAAQANGSTSLIIRSTADDNFRLDGIQVEQTSGYYTTYIDGDLGEGYRWSGLHHASTSSRKDDVRSGGRKLTFRATEADTPDIEAVIKDEGSGGLGMTGVVNNTESFDVQRPGAAFRSVKLLSRTIELETSIFADSIATHDEVLSERKLLSDIWKPDAASPGQVTPFIHDAINLNRPLTIDTYYEGGLEIVGGLQSNLEDFTLRLLAVDPFWREDDRQRTTLDFQDTDADADRTMARIDGLWTALGTGMNASVVSALAYDIERGRVYFGGNFTTANSVTVNGICYWDSTAGTFVAMGTGISAPGHSISTIKIAPNGDVWIGGNFTTLNGAAADGLGKWDVSASSWTQFTNGTPTDTIRIIEIDSTGKVYIGGTFANWDGDADADNIAQSTDGGANWTGLATGGANNNVFAMALDTSDNLYVGGDFTSIGGVSATRVAKWDQSTFTIMGSGVNGQVVAMIFRPDGGLYICGAFTDKGNRVTLWSGSDYTVLGDGLNGIAAAMAIDTSGNLLIGGLFTEAGGIDVADRVAGWNNSSWFHLDIDLPGTPQVGAITITENDDIYLGYNTAGTATMAGSTTATNGGTATVSPVITILGPTTADSTAILQWLENQTTGERLYFNMSINTEEKITIDTRAGQVGIFSRFRRKILDNPLDPGGLSLFNLLPGDNVIAAFITGTITGVEMFMDNDVLHHGIEGVAV